MAASVRLCERHTSERQEQVAVLRSKALPELNYLSMDLRFKIVSVEVGPVVMSSITDTKLNLRFKK